ncbi:general transcription factor IIF subunit 1 [Grus japonensis]|uniref:Transcription initiation factor IIF subunit alpha n=1 Tax=Grus japonensis TaxID=30415 RepID=A0ABC9XWD0_GRUJA
MATLGTSSQMVTEYVVRVPKTTTKKYNIMAFNAADKVNFATWHQARMERDLSNKKIYQEEELPESGAGSEFNRRLREEARRKKYGIVLREFRAEDQPWLLRVNGKAGRKYKGVKKGGVTENASYYIFTQCPDGAFEAFPVQHWYNFTPLAKHRTLTAEEAEEEWERRNKVLNHFSIMQQRRLRDQDEEEEEKEKAAKKKGGELKIHDLEDDLELSSEESEGSEAEGAEAEEEGAGGKKKKKKKKGSEDEAFEDSDDGDFEGQEVDYMSDASSSSQEEEVGKPKVTKEDDGPKGIDEASESSEESEEEKAAEEKEEEEEEKKAPTPQEKKKKRDSSDESQTSEESDIDSETSSALFMAKKKTPPKRERRGSASSSRGNSRPGTPTEPGTTGTTLRAAASKLEQGRRQPEPPAAKRLKLDATPQPPSGKSTPSSGEVQLTEDAVRRYLGRKPMTTKDLLKKFQTKRTGLSSDATVNVLAQILKRLNPERKVIGDKMHFFLKE